VVTFVRLRTFSSILLLGSGAALLAPVSTYAAPMKVGANTGLFVVHGVPGKPADVVLDGQPLRKQLAPKEVAGPFDLSPGKHTIRFRASGWTATASFRATARSVDVVVHRPADATKPPEVTVFDNDLSAITAGEARLTIAHTAVVPPADVRVSGKVLFSNIANGEFVTADVPAKTYSVDIVPTGEATPLFGPVDVTLQPGALTRVFAIGEPANGGMDAVVQVLPLREKSVTRPGSVNAGSAGLVANRGSHPTQPGSGPGTKLLMLAFAIAFVGVSTLLFRRRHATR
jgi:hypothetical protein